MIKKYFTKCQIEKMKIVMTKRELLILLADLLILELSMKYNKYNLEERIIQ